MKNIILILLLLAIVSGILLGITKLNFFLWIFGIFALIPVSMGVYSILYVFIIKPIKKLIRKRK